MSALGRALVDKGLYLPSWTSDQDRCEAAGVPRIGRATGPRRAGLEMVGRARRGPPEGGCFAADDAFGMQGRPLTGPGGLGDVVRAGRSVRHYLGRRSLPWTSAEYQGAGRPRKPRLRDWSADHGAAQRRVAGGGLAEITVAEGSQGPRSYLVSAQGCDRPAGASPAKTGPSTAGTGTAANPATTCPDLRRIPRWRPWHTWEAPLAYRNGV